MKIRQTLAASAIALAAFGVSAANAGTVLSDNFDSDTPVTTNWLGDATFVPVPATPVLGFPSVDLVGAADGFANLAYMGNTGGVSVDLDGSTGNGNNPAGEIASTMTLAQGNYVVTFLLAGNMRGGPNQTTAVAIGNTVIDITPLSNTQPYMLYTEAFTNVSGKLTFTDLGPSDQEGDLLDNISVTTAVPEPATWAMMLIGFGAVGFMMRGSRRNQSAALT
jgi:hypothetical protein